MNWLQAEKNRAYLYRVLLAVTAAAVGFGVITEADAALVIPIFTAVLGLGLATANTSTK